MFRIHRLAPSAIFVLTLAFAAFSQTAPKNVLINTAAFFDEKAGITKLVAAEKQIETKFAKDIKELQDGNAKLEAFAAELEKPVTDANRAAMLAKKEEAEALQRRLTYRKAEIEAEVTKEREKLVGPITFDIGKAIAEFGKKNGYGAIFDAAKIGDGILFVGDGMDITKEFIAYYNARSASVPVK
jgi:outer membrane protein